MESAARWAVFSATGATVSKNTLNGDGNGIYLDSGTVPPRSREAKVRRGTDEIAPGPPGAGGETAL